MAGERPYDVVLVGFGPTGATLATWLGRAGHRTLVVERERAVYQLPRAVHFDGEVMRIFQSLGLPERILPFTRVPRRCEFWTADRQILLVAPMDFDNDQGWASDYMFHQPSLEAALREAALEQESVEVTYAALSGLEVGRDGVRAQLDDGRTVESRYLVGCDGASSPVRTLAGLGLEDLGFDEPWMVVDLRGARGLPDFAVQLCDPARPTTLVPGALDFYRFEFMLRPEERDDEMRRPEILRELLSAWLDPDDVEVVRSAVYRFHAVLAREWRRGPVAVAGDAAHQTPPFLGQGMCAGIRDAANLGWKLDRILRGTATDALLDSYGSERGPHVRAFVERAVATGRIICTQDPALAAARDEQMLAQWARGERPDLSLPDPGPGCFQAGDHALIGRLPPQPRVRDGAREGRLDDLVGPGFRLIVRDGAVAPEAVAALARLDGSVVHWSDEAGEAEAGVQRVADADRGAKAFFETQRIHGLLVRPDNLTFGVARAAGDVAPLVADLSGRLGA